MPRGGQSMKCKAMLIAMFVFFGILFINNQVFARPETDWTSNEIYREMKQVGRLISGQVVNVYGIPCVKAKLKMKESIFSFCQLYPSLKKFSWSGYSRIAFINRMSYTAKVRGGEENSTEKDKIYVPLDFSIAPKVLPEIDPELAGERKFIKGRLDLQYVGCYEYGKLKYCFPISSGFIGKSGVSVTPSAEFVITKKEEMHFSNRYNNAPMPNSAHILDGNYFFHGGPLPGYADSHGCIRLFLRDAEIFHCWVEVGTRGRTMGSRLGTFKSKKGKKGKI